MTLKLSDTFRNLLNQSNKQPIFILEIEGATNIYGSGKILEKAKWDDPRINWDNDIGVTWDGAIERANSKPYIDPKKSTKEISQQLIIDKGGSGSVTSMKMSLIDFNKEVAKDLSFDNIGEILGKRANVYYTVLGGIFPDDAVEVFRGYILDTTYKSGVIELDISNPANKLRGQSFEQSVSELTADIDSVTTTIPVISTDIFIESADAVTSYLQVGDEIMEVISKTSNSYEVIRSRLNTLPAPATQEDETVSFYRLQGGSIELALKLMLSNEGNTPKTLTDKITAINQVSNVQIIEGAIIVDNPDIQRKLGLVEDDLITITGSSLNDGTYQYLGSGVLNTGKSYLIVKDPLTVELGLDINVIVKSKYNVLPEGLGLDVDQINTAQFEDVESTFSSGFIDSDFYIKDTISNTKEFIDLQLFRPQGLYSLPNVRLGVKFTAPPFTSQALPTLNTKTLIDMTKIVQKRSTHKYLKNSVVYRYNQHALENKFLDKQLTVSADSFTRITAGRKQDVIEAEGFRRSGATKQVVQRISGAILTRYKYAAKTVLNVKPLFSVGLPMEIGDIVEFGGENTQLANLKTGERDAPIEQYEIINTKKSLGTGSIILTLLETGFSIDGIVGVFSPSSLIKDNASTTKIHLERLWDTSQTTLEREKWEEFVGLKIRVISPDYTFDETTFISELDLNTNDGLILDPPLSSAPLEGYILELSKHEDYGERDLERIVRLRYTFTMPSALLDSVADSQNFDLLPADISKFAVGMEIAVHSPDFTTETTTAIIDSITVNTITLDQPLNILPQSGDRLEVYSYSEDDKGYRFL